MMSRELSCPHCGCPLFTTADTVRVPDMDAVELLQREIEHLRATVARLRGAGFNPLRRPAQQIAADQVADASQTAS